jgi:uncharacterized protein YbcV (DUF1398 family)
MSLLKLKILGSFAFLTKEHVYTKKRNTILLQNNFKALNKKGLGRSNSLKTSSSHEKVGECSFSHFTC